jgi:hypothetical protein
MGMLSKQTMVDLRRGAWYKTVNDPIPETLKPHPQCVILQRN